MLDVVLFIGFIFIAIRVATTIRRESKIYNEFLQSKSLAVLVLLFPAGPVALLALPNRIGWLPAGIIAAICYFPALIKSRQLVKAFDYSGTDRTDTALKSANEAFGAALVGLIYVFVFVVMTISISNFGHYS
jgi:hypothetical protein